MLINPIVGFFYFRRLLGIIQPRYKQNIRLWQYFLGGILYVVFAWELKLYFFINVVLFILRVKPSVIKE